MNSFTIFDGLLYTGKPVLTGTTPITMLQGNALPPAGDTGAYYYDWEPNLTLASAPMLASQMVAQLGFRWGFSRLSGHYKSH